MAYLDKTGLTYLWSKIVAALNGKANSSHTHSYNELTNKPTIPTIPSSLPANGGNADTVDGKHINITSSTPTVDDRNVVTIVI